MRTILILVRKDLANFFRNRTLLVITFAVPIALIYIFGQVWGLNRKDPGPSGIEIAVVNESDNPAAQDLVEALKAEKAFSVLTQFKNPDKSERPLTEADVRAMIHDNDFHFALVIPRDVIATDRIGLKFRILSDPRNDIESQMVNGLLQKTIFTNVPQMLGQSLQERARGYLGQARLNQFNRGIADSVANTFGGDADAIQRRMESGDFGLGNLRNRLQPSRGGTGAAAGPAGAADATDVLGRIVDIKTEQVTGKNVKSPAATRVIGGQAIMFLLFALSGGAAAFFDEKNAGLFQRLLSAPVTRAQLLWSRFVYGILLGLIQLMALFIAGHFLFGVDVFGHAGNLLLVCVAAAAACTAFGMFVAAVAPNAQAASGLATFLVLIMSSTGGAWFPISLMPHFMQTIGKFTLVYWSMEGFSRVLWAENSFVELLPTLGILWGIAIVVMALAIWRLNRKKIFE